MQVITLFQEGNTVSNNKLIFPVVLKTIIININTTNTISNNTYIFKTKYAPDRDRLVNGFISTYAISAYHHYRCEFEPRLRRGVLDTT